MPQLLIQRPQRRSGGFFAMMPLIDVMFLLLIFFMLSSQIAPYSLLPISAAARARTAQPMPAEAPTARPVLVRVAGREVTLDGRVLALAEIEAAFAERVAAGDGSFLVLPSRSATVQDLVTVLEALKSAGAANVALIDGAGGKP